MIRQWATCKVLLVIFLMGTIVAAQKSKPDTNPEVDSLVVKLNSEEWDVRTKAALALGKLHDARAVNPLINAINDMSQIPEADLKNVAMAENILSPKELELYKKALDKKKVSINEFSAACWAAIVSIGKPAIEPLVDNLPKYDSTIYKEIKNALEAIDPQWRQSATAIKAIPELFTNLYHSSYRSMMAADALQEIDPQWRQSFLVQNSVPDLIAALNDKNKRHDGVVSALGYIGDTRAVVPLIDVLKHDMSNKKIAAYALQRIGTAAIDPLIEAAKDPDWQVREAAIIALGGIKDPQVMPPIIAALEDENIRVGLIAIEALKNRGDAQSIEALILGLQNAEDHPGTRRLIIEVLGKMGATQAIEPLIVALRYKNDRVRSEAVYTLYTLDPQWQQSEAAKQALTGLIAELKDKNCRDHPEVIAALGAIGNEQAVEPLIEMLNNKDWRTRDATFKALQKITGEKFNQDVKSWKKWWKEQQKKK